MTGALESRYQHELITDIIPRYVPGAFIIKNDSSFVQGIPDLLVLYEGNWALLEVKRDANAPYEPNQEYYLDFFGHWSFSSVIYPEVEHEVLSALQQAFGLARQTCLFES